MKLFFLHYLNLKMFNHIWIVLLQKDPFEYYETITVCPYQEFFISVKESKTGK